MNIKIALSRPTQLLIAANAVFAVMVSAELLLPAQPGAANAATARNGDAALPEFGDTTIAAAPMTQFVDMMERPLFLPDRRMPQPKVEQSQPIPTKPLGLKLEGIALSGGSRVAVLRNLNGNGLVQLVEGDSYEGWTLDALTSTSAMFSRNGEQGTELLLDPTSNGRRR
jgi:hypothetical protein